MPLVTCPECHSAMQAVARDEILIDVCPSCRGVWLDGGELEKILAATRRHEAERLQDERVANGQTRTEPARDTDRYDDRRDDRRDDDRRRDRRDDRYDRRDDRDDDDRYDKKRRKRRKKSFFDIGDFFEDLFD